LLNRPQKRHLGEMIGDMVVQLANEYDIEILERVSRLIDTDGRRAPHHDKGIEVG